MSKEVEIVGDPDVVASAQYACAIGNDVIVDHNNSIGFGENIQTTMENQVIIKFGDTVIVDKIMTPEEVEEYLNWQRKWRFTLNAYKGLKDE